jgi:hypothetical protein
MIDLLLHRLIMITKGRVDRYEIIQCVTHILPQDSIINDRGQQKCEWEASVKEGPMAFSEKYRLIGVRHLGPGFLLMSWLTIYHIMDINRYNGPFLNQYIEKNL